MADANSVHLVENTFVPILASWNKSHSLTGGMNASAAPVPNASHPTNWDHLQLVAPVVVLAPILGLPALLFITTATLREHVSDPLVALALVVAGKALFDEGLLILGNPLCLAGIVAAKLGLLSRLASTSCEEESRADPVPEA